MQIPAARATPAVATPVIHVTRALCPACSEVVRGELVDRGGDVFLEMRCPQHGPSSNLYFRNAELYRRLLASRNDVTCCDEYHCARGEPCSRRRDETMIYLVNVTNNCNMSCATCYAGSHAKLKEPYSSSRELLSALPERAGPNRHVVFIGGEPTLHPELPDMVREVTRRGYVARLATNGLNLRHPDYTRQLAEAGLRWVFLHFDSLDEDINKRVRGRSMVDVSREAISACRSAGMKVQFGVTVAPENVGELGRLLEEAQRLGVFWVSLYPVAEIERVGESGSMYLADVLDALQEQTGGRIRSEDFVAASRLWSLLHRATGRLNYRQKPTMVSLPVVLSKEGMVPFTRLLNPLGALRSPRAALAFAKSLPSLADYERKSPTGSTMVINVQQLQGRSAFDLEEAAHSLMSFMDGESFLPFDVYNHAHRYARPEVVTLGRSVG